MTDYRHCDGPDCEEKARLEESKSVLRLSDLSASDFIVLSCPRGDDKHFHNSRCMTNWTLQNTKAGKRVDG